MVTIRFIDQTGVESTLECEPGDSLMTVAARHGIPGIIGECGGNCACATCHVYLADPWLAQVPPPGKDELAMLEGVLDPQQNSRLGCRVAITEALDGMVVQLPARQV